MIHTVQTRATIIANDRSAAHADADAGTVWMVFARSHSQRPKFQEPNSKTGTKMQVLLLGIWFLVLGI
jgi:hypothetical protein